MKEDKRLLVFSCWMKGGFLDVEGFGREKDAEGKRIAKGELLKWCCIL
jgi:hypothetical protein